MSDSIPTYESQIAPPATTGEVLDTQTAQLEQAKVGATLGVYGAAQNVADQTVNLMSTLQKVENLRGRELYAQEKNRLIEESRQIVDMVSQTPGASRSWATDPSGEMGSLLKQWHDEHWDLVNEDLTGRWRQQLELDFDAMTREMAGKITEDVLDHSYKSIVAADTTWLNEEIKNADPQNIGENMARILTEYGARLNNRLEMGVNDPAQVAQEMFDAQAAVTGAHVMAAAKEIDDGDADPWVFEKTGKEYNGHDGAIEFIDDLEADGTISSGDAEAYRQAIVEQDTAKYSRGIKVQNERSNAIRQKYEALFEAGETWTEHPVTGQRVPINQAILAEPGLQAERARFHNTVGDSATTSYLLNRYDDLISPDGTDEEGNIFRSEKYMEKYYDPTISEQTFEQFVFSNMANQGYNDEEANKLIRARASVDTWKRSELRRAIDQRFNPLLAQLDKDDQAGRMRVNAQRAQWESAVMEAIEGPGIETMAQVREVIENVNRAFTGAQITEAVLKADPRQTNPHEEVLLGIAQGHYMGIFDVPGVADMMAKVAEVGRQQIVEMYGGDESVIEKMMWGRRGTVDEGRMFYLVTDSLQLDADGNPKKLWVKWDALPTGKGDGVEEQLLEWDGSRDAIGNEEWRPTQRPLLDELAAEYGAQEEATDQALYDAYFIQGDRRRDLVLRFGQERVDRVLGPEGAELTPDEIMRGGARPEQRLTPDQILRGAANPQPLGPTERQYEWHTRHSDNGKIDITSLNSYLMGQPLPPEGDWTKLYMTIADDYSRQIKADIDARGITPFNDKGEVKSSAGRIVGRIIEEYGIPRRYAEDLILKYYGAP